MHQHNTLPFFNELSTGATRMLGRRYQSWPSVSINVETASSQRDVSSHLPRITDAERIDFPLKADQVGAGTLVAGTVLQHPDVRIGDEDSMALVDVHDLVETFVGRVFDETQAVRRRLPGIAGEFEMLQEFVGREQRLDLGDFLHKAECRIQSL